MRGEDRRRRSGQQRHFSIPDRIGQQILTVLREQPGAGSTQGDRLAEVSLANDLAAAVLELFDTGPDGELLLEPRVETGTGRTRGPE